MGLAVLATAAILVVPAAPSVADSNEAPGAPGIFRSITAGSGFTCVRMAAGQVKCWGSNADWRLGYSDQSSTGLTPRGDEFREMGADLETIVLGAGRSAVALSSGRMHTCAILDDAGLKCWGKSTNGQLGHGSTFGASPGDDLVPVALGSGRTAVEIAAGAVHTCAILDNDDLKCWGANSQGQLGLGDTASRGDGAGEMGDNLPDVDLGTGRTATAVTGGLGHTCALLDNGSIKCWGDNTSGQLGLGDNLARGDDPGEMGDDLPAVDLGTGRTAVAVTAGDNHTCALLDNGAVKCWGFGDVGQLGLGDGATRGDAPGEMGDSLPAVDLGTGRTATAITTNAEGAHTCALLDNGSVKCWGNNTSGQLGLGDGATRGDAPGGMGDNLPAVDLGTGRTAVAVTAGDAHTCAVLDNATFKCWGRNNSGQLGLGDSANRGDGAGEMGDNLPAVSLTGSGIAGRVQLEGAPHRTSRGLVAVIDANDQSLAGADTTSNLGTYSIAVPAGTYLVYVIDVTGSYTSSLFGAPTVITVNPGQLTTVDPVLTRSTGSITGTVTETGSGTPLAGVTVLRMNASLTAVEGSTTTDGSGQYSFTDLSPGNRVVAFMDSTGAHPIRFHPSASSAPAAAPVPVTPGGTAVADGSLPSQPTPATSAAITGKVTTATGGNLSNVTVVALRQSDYAFTRAATTDGSGNYSLLVPTGAYKLLFVRGATHVPEWYDNRPNTDLSSANSVSAPGVANAALAATTGRLDLTFTESGGGGTANDWVVLIGSQGIVRAFSYGGQPYVLQMSGLPVGNYRLALVDPNLPHVEFYADAPDYASSAAFAITASNITNLTAVLGP